MLWSRFIIYFSKWEVSSVLVRNPGRKRSLIPPVTGDLIISASISYRCYHSNAKIINLALQAYMMQQKQYEGQSQGQASEIWFVFF